MRTQRRTVVVGVITGAALIFAILGYRLGELWQLKPLGIVNVRFYLPLTDATRRILRDRYAPSPTRRKQQRKLPSEPETLGQFTLSIEEALRAVAVGEPAQLLQLPQYRQRNRNVELLFEKARDKIPQNRVVYGHTRNGSRGVVLIGKASSDATGPNRSFIPEVVGIETFSLSRRQILIVANCEFSGPYYTLTPGKCPIYYVAMVKDLPPGRYFTTVRFKKRGDVYEKWKGSRGIQLPELPPLRSEFEVARQ